MNENIIIEYNNFEDKGNMGVCIKPQNIIFIRDINMRNVLIHETVHKLWNERNAELGRFCKKLGFTFTTNPNKAIQNNFFNVLNVKFLKKAFKPEDWITEALAFIIGESDDSVIRMLSIHELDKILDGDFNYYKANGDCYHYNNGFQANYPDVPRLIKFVENTHRL